jgi:2-dehydropantoate 2-reductase
MIVRQKVCVFGAGAVGSYLAAQLSALPDIDLSIVARGTHLQAIRSDGLRIVAAEGTTRVRHVNATDRPAELDQQDIVFVTLKTYAQTAAAPAIAALMGEASVAVFVANGIPWWWNYGRADATSLGGVGTLPLLDPDETLWRLVRPERLLGCVVYSTNDVQSPGVVVHAGNNYWVLGEPSDGNSARLATCADLLRRAGLRAEISPKIRKTIWTKALRNGSLSPICAITRQSISKIGIARDIMTIVDEVVDELGQIALATGVSVDDEIALAKQVARRAVEKANTASSVAIASDRPSMLHDVLRGRPLETEAILGQPYRFACEANVDCPRIATLLPLLRALSAPA